MATTTDSIGRVLSGRYRIESAIGTGASAHVFAARDVTLKRLVAVKMLHPALAGDAAFLRRFRAEAQAAAALTHPHVLAVFDWGEDDQGPFLVLEYMGGGSLRDALDGGKRLTLPQAVHVGLQAAQGLAYAHSRGFVHRDIKPANLLFDEEGRLELADFGLARALSEAALTEPAGATVGTARYAAPEQATGSPVDGRADVYALALVLYESVTGSVPFTSDTTIATLMARVGTPLPDHPGLGPLAPLLTAAAAPDVADRMDAAAMARSLDNLARELPRPAPLPLAGAGGQGMHRPTGDELTELGVIGPPRADPGGRDAETSDVLAVATAVGVAEMRPQAPPRPVAGRPDPRRRPPGGYQPVPPGPPASVTRARRRRWPWALGVVLILVAALAGVGGYLAVRDKVFTASHPVPSVAGLSVAAADQKLRPDHLSVRVTGHRYSTTVPAGVVLRQIPGPGAPMKEGSVLHAVVSGGPPPVPVPDLSQVHGTCSDFTQALATEHLHADCQPQASTSVPAGTVITWSPKGEVAEFSTVRVEISSGPPLVAVPSLVGISTCQGVTNALAAVHLQANCSVRPFATVPAGQLAHVVPSQQAQEGTTVTVVISSGPPPVPVPAIPHGGSLTDELAALQAAGLVPGNIYGPGHGRVFNTDPAPGTSVPTGSTVNIYTI
jgi:eukaryotic-like serine/threonine-protein kinase